MAIRNYKKFLKKILILLFLIVPLLYCAGLAFLANANIFSLKNKNITSNILRALSVRLNKV